MSIDLTGDGRINDMANDIQSLRQQVAQQQKIIDEEVKWGIEQDSGAHWKR